MTPTRVSSVLVIGAGFAGIGAAIRLKAAGIHDIAILERAEDVGGTWRDNTYPGAACDVPSHLYSFSFAPNPDWSHAYSRGAEILAYARGLVEQHELRARMHFRQDVTDLAFDAGLGIWRATTATGDRFSARAVIMAAGPLANPSLPDIPGLATFAGRTIHSARWDHGYDVSGKRVAVIGTGASAVQIVPALVQQVARLEVFQRTPAWVMPRPDTRTPPWLRALFRDRPAIQAAVREVLFWTHETLALGIVWTTPLTSALERLSRWHLERQVADPWLRRQLAPSFRIGCKRVLMSNDFYPALQRDNCELVTWPIVRITETGIVTADGVEHRVDCIVCATGFDVCKAGTPFPITGLDGRRLADEWSSGARAFKSVSVAGYPNLFFTLGPSAGPGHNSALVYLEAELAYIVAGVRRLLHDGVKYLDVDSGAQDRYNTAIQRRLRRTNWSSGCKSWYLTDDGFNATMYPGFATQFRRQLRAFDVGDYRIAFTTTERP